MGNQKIKVNRKSFEGVQTEIEKAYENKQVTELEIKIGKVLRKKKDCFAFIKNTMLFVFLMIIVFFVVIFKINEIQSEWVTWIFKTITSLMFIGTVVIIFSNYILSTSRERKVINLAIILMMAIILFYFSDVLVKLNFAWLAMIGYLVNVLFTQVSYSLVFHGLTTTIIKEAKNDFRENKFACRMCIAITQFFSKNLLLNLISPTYYFAGFYKKRLDGFTKKVHLNHYQVGRGEFKYFVDSDENHRIELWDIKKRYREQLIIFLNWMNVCKIIVIACIILFIWGSNNVVIKIFFWFLVFHFLSRSLEIILAFYHDTVTVKAKTFIKRVDNLEDDYEILYLNKWKNSSIRRTTRISLAVYSLIEMIISFSILYYFLCLFNQINPNEIFPTNNEILSKISYNNYIFSISKAETSMFICNEKLFEQYPHILLHSIEVSFFNISFIKSTLIHACIHMWQVLMSIVLISISIASYLGSDDNVSEREASYFSEIEDTFCVK
ncbi:hypothetical protein [Bacillus cereus]|uniref:hypothetical protein n=1 Tax=Bacillus cereus TaxID=1396 RepID=UPI000BF3FA73|nr:hypothetical protein [Bacillus cereus]PFD04464.1 hypothetical protein CN295_30745 [Bacillus cereus]